MPSDKEKESWTNGKSKTLKLRDGRILVMGNEPDIGLYKDDMIQIAEVISAGTITLPSSCSFVKFVCASFFKY